jgi:hypothetical protein
MFVGMAVGLVTAISWLALVLFMFDREVARQDALQRAAEVRRADDAPTFVDPI